jgi:hypothetical protein
MSRLRWAVLSGAAAGLACIAAPPSLSGAQAQAQAQDQPPPNARPGECYGKVILPPVYGTSERRELVHEAWTETRRTPAVVRKTARKVLVRPARDEKVRTAPVYRTVVSWVTRPGVVRRVSEPDRYRTIREKVLVEPGHSEWRRTDAPLAYGETASGQTVLQSTGEIVCRVWVPPRYKFVEREVLVARGRTHDVVGPPRRKRVVHKVLVSKGGWTVRHRAAVYRTEYVKQVVRPGRTELVEHAPVYRIVETPVLVRPAHEGWSRVLCGGQLNPAFMAQVQQALIARGFDPGPPDGAGRPQTYAALRAFQRQHGLAQGQLTLETAHALGVI